MCLFSSLCATELLLAISILLKGCKLMLNLFSVEFRKQRYNLNNRLVSIQSLCCNKRFVALFLLCIVQFCVLKDYESGKNWIVSPKHLLA